MMYIWIITLFIYNNVFSFVGSGVVESPSNECGYKGCPETSPNKINVHLICHTHDDVGWVKTADEYFFGGRRSGREPHQAVEQILDSVVSELLKSNDRRFVYVESAFLWRWWLLKESNVREAFVKLVNEGRLQLLGGGWVMSDEATPHYSALIDQMTLGHKFLKDTFGECNLPKVAWQIDPFGHSSEVALEFAQMGFDGLFFSRMDIVEFEKRREEKSLEMLWRPDSREGPKGELFTGQTFDPLNPYHPPKTLCFDIKCADDPVIDNKLFHGYNVVQRANDFIRVAKDHARQYKTKNVMFTMGGDFHYLVASSWFNNLDRLIKYINKNSTEVHVTYSTPACYLKSLHESNIEWPVKKDEDFFPYGGTRSEIWTGYFTSRPGFKDLVHKTNNFFQACKQLRAELGDALELEQFLLARAMAMAQHHDAVSGTEKQFVTEDYKQYLSEGIDGCQKIVNATLSQWQDHKYKYEYCPKLNVSECEISEKETNFVVNIYNPQAHVKEYYINIPVEVKSYKVLDQSGNEVPFDLIALPEEVKAIPGRKNYSLKPCQLIFKASNLLPLGLTSYFIEAVRHSPTAKEEKNIAKVKEYRIGVDKFDPIIAENENIMLKFDEQTGLLTTIKQKTDVWEFKQNFYFYKADSSGAYLFHASGEAEAIAHKAETVRIAKGKNVVEVEQRFSPFLSQIIRLYNGKDDIEFEWVVGPLPNPMQVITRYQTTMSEGTFYTDSNGRRLLKRQRGDRIETSYYPITSAAVLEDKDRRLTILADRSQGAANWINGAVEIMIHRALSSDDGKGVEEVLNEREYHNGLVVRGKHIVQLSSSKEDGAKRHRTTAQDIAMGPIIMFSKGHDITEEQFLKDKDDSKELSIIKTSLPENIHLLTLERWTNSTVLLRLEHLFETGESSELSKSTTVSIKDLFKNYEVTGVVERSLAGTFERSKMTRLQWKAANETSSAAPPKVEPVPESLVVTLQPMEIRTFEVSITSTLHEELKSDASRTTKLSFTTLSIIFLLNMAIMFLVLP